MTPVSFMIFFAVLFVMFNILCFLNFARINPEDLLDKPTSAMAFHALFGGIATLSGYGLLGSFIWFLVLQFRA